MGILLCWYSIQCLACSRDNDGEDPHKKQLQEMFAGNDKEIDAEKLILIIDLDKLMSVFDIAACCLMIAMIDVSS